MGVVTMNEPKPKAGTIGSSVDDFLREQRILEWCEEQAITQILADQIKMQAEPERPTKPIV